MISLSLPEIVTGNYTIPVMPSDAKVMHHIRYEPDMILWHYRLDIEIVIADYASITIYGGNHASEEIATKEALEFVKRLKIE